LSLIFCFDLSTHYSISTYLLATRRAAVLLRKMQAMITLASVQFRFYFSNPQNKEVVLLHRRRRRYLFDSNTWQ